MRRSNFSIPLPFLLGLALVGYLLPWVITPATGLSLGAYDLAEWSSLHPTVRQTLPLLWTTLMLRVPLALLGVLIATYLVSTFHCTLLALTLILITAIALLPPLEFFTLYSTDPNYQQQLILALTTVAIGILATKWRNKWTQGLLSALLAAIGTIAAAIGLYQGYTIMQTFNLPITVGYGGLITVVSLGAATFAYITKQSSLATLSATEVHTRTAT